MQVEHKTEKGAVLFLKVPYDANKFSIKKTRKGKPDQLHYFVPYAYDVVIRLEFLTRECFQIIGLTSEITEEQAKIIVDKDNEFRWPCYTDLLMFYNNALDSLKSLMQHLKVYEVNPIPTPEFQSDRYGNGGYCETWTTEYQEAQSRTGKWLVLFKPEI